MDFLSLSQIVQVDSLSLYQIVNGLSLSLRLCKWTLPLTQIVQMDCSIIFLEDTYP
jgi:hypothetical protein